MSGGEAGRDKLDIDNLYLCGSTFTRVSLKGAVFADTHLSEAQVRDVNAAGMVFDDVNLSAATFHNVNLSGARIDDANLRDLAITRADLTGATLDGIPISDMIAAWDAAQPTPEGTE